MLLDKIKWKIRAHIEASRVYRKNYKSYSRDSNFDIQAVLQGFEFRGTQPIKPEFLERIIDAYAKAKEKQKTVADHYLVGNEWLPIYHSKFKASINALESHDADRVLGMYANFMRDPVSAGLHGMPVNMQRVYFSGTISRRARILYLIDSLHRYKLWRSYMPDTPLDALLRPDIGNPYGVYIDGKFIIPGSEYLHYYADQTLSLCKNSERPTVVELGGGYGGYAYFLQKLSDRPLRYVDVDLPEVLALATYYLMCAYPEKTFVLYGEGGMDLDCDFMMLPNFEIENLPSKFADVIFNSYSLAEMSPAAIKAYVEQFGRISRGHLLHINHISNAVVGADSFGIENAGFEQVYRKKALWNLGRNLNMDEFEFLYRKTV